MSRRSTRIQANANPATPNGPTKRQSVISSTSSTTQRSKQTTAKNVKKKLSRQDISEDLNDNSGVEDQEFNDKSTGKHDHYQSMLLKDDKSIIMRIIRLEPGYNDIKCELGLKRNEKNNVENAPRKKSAVPKGMAVEEPSSPERPRLRHKLTKNYNEDILSNEQLGIVPQGKSRQSIKPNDEKSPRKRYRDGKDNCGVSSEDEVDENSMKNANKSPKRAKPVDEFKNTPSKTRSRTPAKTPRPSNSSIISSRKNLDDLKNTSRARSRTPVKTPGRPSNASTVSSRKNLENMSPPSTPKRVNVRWNNTTLREVSRSKESVISTFQTKTASQKKNSDPLYSPDNDSESGDDNDETYTTGEEDTESSSEGTEFSEYDDEDCDPKCKGNNRKKPKIPKTPSKNTKKISMETPTKSMAKMCLTPSMHQRTANIVKPSTPLQEARLKLHVSVLPKSLPCREEQFNDIYSFLHARLSDKSGGCIYISGVPGTGKTATVNEVIRCLKKSMDAGKLTKFEFIDINGMKLSEPRQAYVQIWKQLTGQQTTWEEAHKLLQGRFSKSNSNRGMTLLLVDELDLLCTKRQDVVYNLLDWPTKTGAKLVVVTIANTMDLPERVLMGKVTSRLGLSRLTFPPYNYKQLEEIVVSRLRGYNAFGGETIQLVARKVAAVSGDARRALDICRRATEIAENNDREVVSMIDVKRAVDEMIASPKIQAIKHCSEMERVFLQAVCSEVHRTGVEEVVFQNVYLQLGPLCTLNGETIPNVTEALAMCARLGAWRLLLCEHSRIDVHQRLLLNVSTDDVQFAIKAVEV